MTASDDVRTARRRYLVVGCAVPVALTLVAVALMLAWLPDMPATVATHWSSTGEPDAFAPAWTVPVGTAVLGLGLTALFATIMLTGTRDGHWGPMMRLLGAASLATTVLVTVGMTWSFGLQRGLADPHDAPGIGLPMLVALLLGVAAGAAGWYAQPNVTTGARATRTIEPLRLAPGERAVWVSTTTMSRAAMVAIVASIVALALGTVVVAATGSAAWWVMLGVTVLLVLLAATTFVFRVRVDDRGLTVASAAGVPRFGVALDDVASAAVTTVNPTADFGGWGVRLVPNGSFGIVLRAGEALQVTRRDGRRFTVTVDDAATAAALLEALSSRVRGARN
ncbi:DUF1648 domain-containing protein [Agromyces sp. NPDC055658]